ncbi:MAG: hypothetical protein D6741_13045, partial [Planctomycetota bacterium]
MLLAAIVLLVVGVASESFAATVPVRYSVSLPNGKKATFYVLPTWGHGYTPYWGELSGAGSSVNERRVDVQIDLPVDQSSYAKFRVEESMTLDPAAPNAGIEGTIPYILNLDVAASTVRPEQTRIVLDGRLFVRGNLSIRSQMGWSGTPVERPRILRPAGNEQLSLQSIFETRGPRPNEIYYVPVAVEATTDEVREGDNVFLLDLWNFPTSWIGYTNADIVLLSAEEVDWLERYHPEVNAALRRWVYNGGTLVIVVPPERENVRSRFLPGSPQPVGSEKFECRTGQAELREYAAAWGRIVLVDRPPTEWTERPREINTLGYRVTPWSHDVLQVKQAIPARNLLTPMTIIGLVSLYFVFIGGVAVWFFIRSKQPYMLTVIV